MHNNFTKLIAQFRRTRNHTTLLITLLLFLLLLLAKSASAQTNVYFNDFTAPADAGRITSTYQNSTDPAAQGRTYITSGPTGQLQITGINGNTGYDAYIVTAPAILAAPGIQYTVSVKARVQNANQPGTLQITRGTTAAQAGSASGILILNPTSTNVNSTSFNTFTSSPFTVSANENLFIGFHVRFTNGNNSRIYLDDITVAATCTQTPIVSIIPQTTTTFCTGGSVVLNSNVSNPTIGRFTYQWFNGTSPLAGETASTYTARTTGNYNVVVTNANLCTSAPSNSVSVTVNTPPTVTLNDPVVTCAGTATTITASPSGGSGFYSYNWAVPGNVTNPGNVASFQILTAGSYSVTVTDTETGCVSATATKVVAFNPLPQAAINFLPVCEGSLTTVAITVTAGTSPYTYNWTTLPAGVPNPGNASSLQTSTAGTYSVTVTDSKGCSVVASTNVIFNPLPTVTLTSPAVCIGTAATVTATATTGTGPFIYDWQVPAGAVNPGNTVSSFTTTVPGEYKVSVTDVNDCASSATASTIVTFNPLPATPTISADGPTTFCPTESVLLTASGSPTATTFTWYNGTSVVQSGASATYEAKTSGNYSVVASDANTCSSAESNTIEVFVYASSNIITGGPGSQRSFCEGAFATLTALTDAGGSYSYQWFTSTDGVIGNGDDTPTGSSTSSLRVNDPGNYYLILTVNGVGGCAITSNLISVIQTPAITNHQLTPESPVICANTAPGLITGTFSGGNGSSYSYVWEMSTTSATTGFDPIPGANGQNLIYNQPLTQDTWFRQTVTSVSCTSTQTVLIDVTPLPTATIDANGPLSFCAGSNVVLTASTGDSWLWSNGQTSQSITVSQSGNYTVTVTQNSCSATSTAVAVTVNTPPAASISSTIAPVNGSIAICANTTVTLTANPLPSSGISYEWSNGATSRTISVSQAGTYSVTVTNGNNCSATASATVTVKSVPTVLININGKPQTEYTVYTGDGSIPIQGLADGQVVSGTFDINGSTIGNTLSTCVGSNLGTPSNTPKILTFTHTTADGCIVKATANILFQQSTFSIVVLSNPKPFCQGDNVLHEAFVYRDANVIYPYLVHPVTKQPVQADLVTPIGPQELPVSNPDFPFPANTPDVVKFYAYRFFNPIVLSGTPVTSGLTYQWTKNQNQNIGNDGKTFENAGLSSLDYYAAYVSATSAANTCGPNFRNTLSTRTYTGQIAEYGITVAGTPNPVCPNIPVTFTAKLNSAFTFWNDINLKLNWVVIRGANRIPLGTTTYDGTPASLTLLTSGPTGGFVNGDQVTVNYTSVLDQFYANSKCANEAASNAITMTVNLPTAISTQPAPETVCEDFPTSLSVTATGTNLSYQWYKNGTAITLAENNTAQSATLSFAAATENDEADYYVIVGGACAPAPITSSTVRLTVNPTTPHTVNVAQDPEEIQAFESVTFTATSSLATLPDVMADPTKLTYSWFINRGTGYVKVVNNNSLKPNELYIEEVPLGTFLVQANVIYSGTVCVSDADILSSAVENNPLPVELLYLKATKQNNDVVAVEWATAMEKNSEGFEVQVSQDAKNYRTLAFVASKAGGNTNEKQVYTFHDKENGKYGTRYYRLMQRDMNGDSEYFGPKAVRIGEAAESMSVYPNPFSQEVTLSVNAEASGSMHVLVTNAIGAKVLERTLNIQKGTNKQNLQFNNNLPQGIYHITTHLNGKVQHFKLLKQ